MLDGLLFDLDGVITDTAEFHFLAWKELANELGIDINRKFNEKLKGVSRLESLDLILKYGNQEQTYTKEEKNSLATKKNEHYKTLIESITPEDLLPGIFDLLQNAKDKNLKLAIASASKNAPVILEKLEVSHLFDTIVDPASLKNGKPDPEIFATATKQLNLKPNNVVGIEDAHAGIQAINSAGIFSIGIGSEDDLSEADIVIPTTEMLTLQFIERVFSAH